MGTQQIIYGAKLLGAGGGGFLFIVTKGYEESKRVKEILEKTPPNDRASFFDFDVDYDGQSRRYTYLSAYEASLDEMVSGKSRQCFEYTNLGT